MSKQQAASRIVKQEAGTVLPQFLCFVYIVRVDYCRHLVSESGIGLWPFCAAGGLGRSTGPGRKAYGIRPPTILEPCMARGAYAMNLKRGL